MKPYLSVVCLLLVWAPAVSRAGDQRVHPLPSDVPEVVLPITADLGEPRSAIRLRDALRQPYDEAEDDNKPYRMSAEERQRLREQLRSQSFYDQPKK